MVIYDEAALVDLVLLGYQNVQALETFVYTWV